MSSIQPTEEHVKKIVELTRLGVCTGLGNPNPGEMCIEAIVSNVVDGRHDSSPSCVVGAVRQLKINLNDLKWYSPLTRGLGLQKIAIAQLGSRGAISEAEFQDSVCLYFVQILLPALVQHVLAQIKLNERKPAHFASSDTVRYAVKFITANRRLAREKLESIASLIKCVENHDKLGSYNDSSSVSYLICKVLRHETHNFQSTLGVGLNGMSTIDGIIKSLSYYCGYAGCRPASVHLRSVICQLDAVTLHAIDENDTILKACAEAILKALIKVNSPGCQWLHLADTSMAA